jgi:phosphoglycolate phosphatase
VSVFNGVRAVLFDLDGTLIDSAPDLAAAADQMRVVRGMPSLPFERYRPMTGAGARGMVGVAFGIGPDDPQFAAYREEFFANYAACMTQRTQPFAGVSELVEQLLRRGLRWGVVTNKSARFAVPLTEQMALFSSSGALVCGDTTAYSKPHPEPLLEAARRLGLPPAQCLYVGDDERDIVAGLAAGMGSVAATYGYLGANEDTRSWGAHAEIKSPLGLLQLLAQA